MDGWRPMWNTTKIWRLMWTEQYELLLRVPDLVKKLYEEPLNNNVQSSRTLIGMSACCSLDEPGKPSFVEHRSRLPPSQIARASSGRASYLAHNEAGAPARPDTADPAAPRRSNAGECLPLHGAPWWPEGRGHGRQARFPHQGACTGGSRLRLPGLRLEFQKVPPSCDNFGGRRWVRTTGFSLVRRVLYH